MPILLEKCHVCGYPVTMSFSNGEASGKVSFPPSNRCDHYGNNAKQDLIEKITKQHHWSWSMAKNTMDYYEATVIDIG